jgi:DNA-binding MarR family transcriptional regulator
VNDSVTTRRLAELFQAFGAEYKRWLHAAAESELRFVHMRVLAELAIHGPMMMGALGQELCVTPRYVTALIDALEAEQLVRRLRHPSDRRATLVELTPAGKSASSAVQRVLDRAHEGLLSALTREQQESLLGSLEALLAEVQRSAPGDGRPSGA